MPSELFVRLYQTAYLREHMAIDTARNVMGGLDIPDLLTAGRLARKLNDAQQEFETDLLSMAHHGGMRVHPVRVKCPQCGDENCVGALMASAPVLSGIALLKQLLGLA